MCIISEPCTTNSQPFHKLAPDSVVVAFYSGTELSRSRSSHALKSRESSPERPGSGEQRDGAALSSWARYLKNKYGNRSSGTTGTGTGSSVAGSNTGSSSDASRRLSLGLPLHATDDEPKNTQGSPTSPRTAGKDQLYNYGTYNSL